jgi:hypothetical protein
MMWTQERLTSFANEMFSIAKNNLVEYGSATPMLFLCTEDKGVMAIALQFGSTEEKRTVYRAMEKLITEHKPSAIVLINESWVKSVEPGAHAAITRMEKNGVRAEPDRKEALLMVVSPVDAPDQMQMQMFHHEDTKIVFDGDPISNYTECVNYLLPDSWKLRKNPKEAVLN